MTSGPTPKPLDHLATIDAFLQNATTASLATVDEDGLPHACNINYAAEPGWDHATPPYLVFVSNPNSAHAIHLLDEPAVGMTIYGHVGHWSEIHGLQLHGYAAALKPGSDEHGEAWTLYTQRYPFVLQEPALAQRLASESLHLMVVNWLRWIDNREGFGQKVEMVWEVE